MGLSLQLAATISFLMSLVAETISSACAQALQDFIPPFQLNFFRYIVQLVLTVIILLVKRPSMDIYSVNTKCYLFATCILSIIFNVSFFSAASRLPLGTLVILMSVIQIISVLVLHKTIFKESIPLIKVIIIPLILVGLYLMLEPQLDQMKVDLVNTTASNNKTVHSTVTDHATGDTSKNIIGIVLAIIAGLSITGFNAVINRNLQRVDMLIISLWICLMGTIASVLLAFYFDPLQYHLTLTQGLLLLGHSFGAAVCSILAIFGFQYVPIITWAIIDNLRIILNLVLQYTVMRSIVHVIGNAYEISGMVVVFICIVFSVAVDVYVEIANSNFD